MSLFGHQMMIYKIILKIWDTLWKEYCAGVNLSELFINNLLKQSKKYG